MPIIIAGTGKYLANPRHDRLLFSAWSGPLVFLFVRVELTHQIPLADIHHLLLTFDRRNGQRHAD